MDSYFRLFALDLLPASDILGERVLAFRAGYDESTRHAKPDGAREMISIFRWRTGDSARGVWLWIILIGGGSTAFSRAFACATPFAALATLAAFTLRPRDAIALVAFVWAANQAIGFGLLYYPHDATAIAWGVAIGLAAFGGLAAAQAVAMWSHLPIWSAMIVALIGSYFAYEAALFAATWPLASGSGAFTAAIVLRIFGVNAASLALLLVVHRLVGAPDGPMTYSRI